MKPIYRVLSVLTVLASQSAAGVNLVPNPSFENFTLCPTSVNQLNPAVAWSSPTQGSPDYFNVCATPSGVGVPANWAGNQPARTGSAYVLVGVAEPALWTDFREYIEVQLSSPLVAGVSYDLSFYVSLADGSDYATSSIGAHFSAGSTGPQPQNTVIGITPQIENPAANIFTDKTGWTPVGGTYLPTGGEDHLTIGNFYDDANTVLVTAPPPSFPFSTGPYSSFYIDDVSVEGVASCCNADIDADGVIGLADFGIVLNLRWPTQRPSSSRWGRLADRSRAWSRATPRAARSTR